MTAVMRKAATRVPPHLDAEYILGPPAPVEICQIETEFARVLDLYREKQPRRVLEIGTASGGTLWHWLTAENPELELVVSLDWPESGYALDQDLCLGWAPPDVTCALVQGDSHDPQTVNHVREFGPFDWLFIDGAHTYTDAVQDWDNYRAMCNPGAIVLFHDIALRRSYPDGTLAGVEQLWREIQAEGFLTIEYRAKPLAYAYGIGAVRLS